MEIREIQKLVIEEFSGESSQKMYAKHAESGLWKSEEKLIRKYWKQKLKILDIGCGTGRTTIPLYKKGYNIIGIDITPKMIEIAKKITKKNGLKIDYRIGNATNLKFRNSSFDYVLFSNQGWTQIPGNENRLKVLKEINRVLKKEGIYIFSVHNRIWFSKRFFFWLWKWFKFYILKNLRIRIEEVDFGDRFFDRENSGTKFKSKQYIHIASISEVKKQIKKAGFKLIYYGTGLSDISGTKPIFFVCKK